MSSCRVAGTHVGCTGQGGRLIVAPTAGGPDGVRWEPAAANEKAGVRWHTCLKFRPACDMTAHPPSNAHSIRYPNSQLRHGALAAHEAIRLMLLGSPPDMVHGTSLRETESSTPLIRVRRHSVHPPSGVHPRCSGLRVTGHRWLPDWCSLANGRVGIIPQRKDFSNKQFYSLQIRNMWYNNRAPEWKARIWACSSAGRAFGSHPRGREFESLQVHQKQTCKRKSVFLCRHMDGHFFVLCSPALRL